jgi:uncharacterized Zn finger protein
VLEFVAPQENIEAQLEDWIRNVFESNDELVATMERLRDAFCAQLAGNPVRDDDEILAQVEAALQNAAKAKHVV